MHRVPLLTAGPKNHRTMKRNLLALLASFALLVPAAAQNGADADSLSTATNAVNLEDAAAPQIGMLVVPPSQRGYSVDSIRESGERGGLLYAVGTNFTAVYNQEMGDAMELWNAHRYPEARQAFQTIRQNHPESPWAAEAELHEGCYHKFNREFDDAEDRYLSLLRKYPNEPTMWHKVLHYLPHLYFETGRFQTALEALDKFQEFPLDWKEDQFAENYRRVFWRAWYNDRLERLCGTKALALVLAARQDELLNRPVDSIYSRQTWAGQKAQNPDGYSLQELADLAGGSAVQMSIEELRAAATSASPILVYLSPPAAPKCFAVWSRKAKSDSASLTGHFLAVEQVADNYVDVLDPSGGKSRWPLSLFLYRWSGKGLQLPGQSVGQGRLLPAGTATQLRGGCCGSPPRDPSDDGCSGAEASGLGGALGGCTACAAAGAHQAPLFRFGLASADLILMDSPMWLPQTKGPAMEIQLAYHRVATLRMANYQNVNYNCLGNKWTLNYACYLTVNPSQEAEIVLPGGRVETFGFTNGVYTASDPWNEDTFVKTADNAYFRLTFKNSQETYVFNANTNPGQRLEWIEDRYGVRITMAYASVGHLQSVTDSLGRSFQFYYNAGGYLANITDSLGRHCAFNYLNGNLVSMTDMGGLTTAIEYDANQWVTKITYPNTSVYNLVHQRTNLYYDDNGVTYTQPYRLTVTDNLTQSQEYFYHGFETNGPVTVSDKVGNRWAYALSNSAQNVRIYADCVDATATYPEVEGNQWEYRKYDINLNLVDRSITTNVVGVNIGYSQLWGDFQTNQTRFAYKYDTRHNLTNQILYSQNNSLGQWNYGYDARDNVTSARNPLNQTNLFGYDARDRITSLVNASNQLTSLVYDTEGALAQITDPRQHSVQWIHDGNGFNTEIHYPDNQVIYRTPDAIGRVSSVRHGFTGLQLQLAYDNLDRLTQIDYPDGTRFEMSYGCCGVETAKDRLGKTTIFSHDSLGRTSQVLDPLNRAVDFEYNGINQITRLTTHVGTVNRPKQFQYEPEHGSSRLKHIISPLGKTVDFTYDFRGHVQTVGNTLGTVQYAYDNLGRLQTITLPTETQTITYRDVLGNVNSVTSPSATYTYDQYDALNQVTHLTASLNVPGFTPVTYSMGYQYDADGNVSQRALTLPGLATPLTATYTWDNMERLSSVSETASGFATVTAGYQYDGAGRLWLTTYGNNDQVERGYDTESRLRGLTIRNGATTLKSFVYVPDVMGNLQSISTDSGLTSYTYDAGYQLVRETLPNGQVNEWDYDSAGNVVGTRSAGVATGYMVNNDDELTEASSGGVTVTGTVTGGPNNNKWYNSWAECRGVRARVSTVNGSFTLPGVPLYAGANALQVKVTDVSGNSSTQPRNVTKNSGYPVAYDASGNLQTRTTSQGNWVYTWNAFNQLVSASLGGTTVLQNWYDAYGRRIAKQEVISGITNKYYYIYDGWAVVAVVNGANGTLLESYTRGVGLAGDVGTLIAARHHAGTYNNQVIYLHSNHRGDVILARNGATTIGAYDYAPYGALRSTSGAYDSRFKFSSKERDASTDIYYFGYRFYDPNLQRWLNRDPLGEAGGINLYAFCYNDPINMFDPLGLSFWSSSRSFVVGTVGGAVATLAVGTATVVATVAASPVIAIGAGAAAVGAVAYGGYQLGKGIFEVGTGEEAYTGLEMSGEERIDEAAGIAGGLLGGGLVGKGFAQGREFTRGKGLRIAPFGNRTGHPQGELPHYHRSVPCPNKPGQSMPGQGIGRHRPWESKSSDTSFWDNF